MKPDAGQRVYWTKVSTNTKVRIGHIAQKVVLTLSHMPSKPSYHQYHRPIAEPSCRLREFWAKRVRRECPVLSSQSTGQ
jgi:hypothetical protein